ncbi:MAG: rhodanese-like domain-containing protein [Gammaproteobacteria bacterium]|nr:rhodanese-like domain-containing protein [Gammaproteobacteria bacterium]
MNILKTAVSSIMVLGITVMPVQAGDLKVKITKDIASVTVKHNGKNVTIQRIQDNKNTVIPAFAKTSRDCPPFCINPIKLAPGVETLGEVEVLDYLKKMSDGDSSILVVDSRTPDWVKRGTIPGAVSIPWTKLNPAKGADPLTMTDIIVNNFGAKETGQELVFDYSNAKTLVMFCNGMWCGQSPNNIRNLLKLNYPADKIKWYRGGMQNWENLGLTTVK